MLIPRGGGGFCETAHHRALATDPQFDGADESVLLAAAAAAAARRAAASVARAQRALRARGGPESDPVAKHQQHQH